MTDQSVRTKWGRTRFGNGTMPALTIAVPAGILLGSAAGWVSVLAGVGGPYPVVGFVAFTLCLTLPGVALVFALVVDRDTLEGAAEHPDDSVESGWYDRATSRSFTDLILVLGLASIVLSFIPTEFAVDLKLVLPAVLLVCFLSFGVRYLLQRYRG